MMPKVDLGFAISATGVDAEDTYEKMKDVVKSIVETYGLVSIRYGVISFGKTPSTNIAFSQSFPDKDVLLRMLDLYLTPRGTPDLQKALEEAKTLFDRAPARPDAKKVLAVIMDSKSSSDPDGIAKAAEALNEDEIQVIPVGIGSNIDDKELESITNNKDNVVGAEKDEDMSVVGKEIMEKVQRSEYFQKMFLSQL